MGGKKKASPAKTWSLAGEPVYSPALSPSEERVFKETVSHFREIAARMRDESDRFSRAVAAARAGQQAAWASAGFFCRYFEGKYQRIDIVKALAAAAVLPAPSAEYLGTSPTFMLGAALWLLDYVKRRELEERFYPLLPEELDEEIDFATPDVDDLNHSRDEILGVMAVFMNRKRDSRQAFKKICGLVDKETALKMKNVFKDAVLDYFDRFLEVSARVASSAPDGRYTPMFPASPPLHSGFFGTGGFDQPGPPPEGDPAKDHAALWFLTNTALLIGASPERIRKTLHYRRSSELMEGFQIQDPYAVCAAFLLLERDGDVLANLNMLTAAVVLCAERSLPWGADEAYTYAAPFEEGAPDYSLQYSFRPAEDAEEEDLPNPDIEEGDRLSEGQLFYLATGYALPRDEAPSSRLKSWFMEQGVPEGRSEALAWGAWFASYVDDLRARRPAFPDIPDDFGDFLKSLDDELTEMARELSAEEADSAVQTAELTRQLKESRKIIHETERNARQLQERLRSAEAEALQDRAELSQLRETLFELRAREGQPEDESEAEIAFPYQTERRIVAFGGHDTWRKAIRPMLPSVRFFDREMLPDIHTVKGADVVWIQSNAISHKFFYRIIDAARKENIPVRYFGFASARKCAEQLVKDEQAAGE